MSSQLTLHHLRLARIAALTALCLFGFAAGNQALSQNQANVSDDDKVYPAAEVDKKAVIDSKRWNSHAPSPAGCKGTGTVLILAVLRKSGHVTNLRVLEKGDCDKFEERAKKTVLGAKFKPAKKGGVDVSTFMNFEFHYNCGGSCP